MVLFIFAVFLTLVCLVTIGLKKTYSYVPAKELKRQARQGDEVAEVLYRAAAYRSNLDLLLWIIIALTAAASFVLFTQLAPNWLAFILVALIVWYGFAWLPNGKLTTTGARLAIWLTPGISWLLNKTQPLLDYVTSRVRRLRPITVHTGLYELDDLLELLDNQKVQEDSRISPATIDLVMHALQYGQLQVEYAMVPRRAVISVGGQEKIGMGLMDKLHASGHTRFPVHGDDQNDIVGILYMHDLINHRQSGTVSSIMRPDVRYIHEEHSLEQALHAFLKTKRHLFVVVNSFEEYTGIVTIEDILEQVIGHKIVDEFDAYDDVRAVAADAAHKEHLARKRQETEPPEAEELPETDQKVVE